MVQPSNPRPGDKRSVITFLMPYLGTRALVSQVFSGGIDFASSSVLLAVESLESWIIEASSALPSRYRTVILTEHPRLFSKAQRCLCCIISNLFITEHNPALQAPRPVVLSHTGPPPKSFSYQRRFLQPFLRSTFVDFCQFGWAHTVTLGIRLRPVHCAFPGSREPSLVPPESSPLPRNPHGNPLSVTTCLYMV